MRYEYDEESDGLYIWFVQDIEKQKTQYEGEIWPAELKDEIGILIKKDGKLMGMEIQPASKYFDDSFLKSLK